MSGEGGAVSHDFAHALPIVGLHTSEREPAKTSDQRRVSEAGYVLRNLLHSPDKDTARPAYGDECTTLQEI